MKMPCIQVGVPANFRGSPKELAFAVRQAIFDKAGELGERDKIPDLYKDFLVQVGFDDQLPDDVYSIQMAFNTRDGETREEYLQAGRTAIAHAVSKADDIYWAFLNVEPEGWTGDWSTTDVSSTEHDVTPQIVETPPKAQPEMVVGKAYDCQRCHRRHPPGPCENFTGSPPLQAIPSQAEIDPTPAEYRGPGHDPYKRGGPFPPDEHKRY